MADKKPEVTYDPTTVYCATPGCKFSAPRGSVLKGCQKCGGKAFVNNVEKTEIETLHKTEATPAAYEPKAAEGEAVPA